MNFAPLLRPLVLASFLPAYLAAATPDQSMSFVIRDSFQFAAAQYTHLLEQLHDQEKYPRTFENGAITFVPASDWTSGYFPGSLWFLFEATGDQKWRDAAAAYTAGIEAQQHNTSMHDIGVMLYASFGHGERLAGNPAYRKILITGAESLSTRFYPVVGAIQSWPLWNPKWSFPVIIDNMIVIELLLWAGEADNQPKFREIAIAHADTTMKNHFRPDGSSYHLLDYDSVTGQVKTKKTFQGASDESAWARGQGWALYGYSFMYRETGDTAYLAHAQKIAAFIMDHPRLPVDKVPYWDFDAPDIPDAPRDASAAAVIASALIELSGFVEHDTAARYLTLAEQQLRSLASPAYRAEVGENGGFLLLHSTGHLPAGREIDVPLNYADYYYLEALLRFQATLEKKN